MEQSFDIKKYLFKILRNWYWFVISISIVYSGFYFKSKSAIQIFNSHTTIHITGGAYNPGEQLIGSSFFRSQKNIQNEIDILRSYYLINKALKELDFDVSFFRMDRFKDIELYNSSPFIVNFESQKNTPYNKLVYIKFISDNSYTIHFGDDSKIRKMKIGEQFVNEQFNFNIVLRNSSVKVNPEMSYYFKFNNIDAITNSYIGRINIKPTSPSSSILWLWITGSVPQKDINFLNKLTEVYIRQGLEEKNEIVVNTIGFIDDRLTDFVDSLHDAENKLQNFRLNNNVADITTEGESLYDKLIEFQSEKGKIEMRTKYYNYLLKDLAKGKGFDNLVSPSAMGIQEATLIQQLTRIIDLYSQRNISLYGVKDNRTVGVSSIDIIDIKISDAKKTLTKTLQNSIEISKINYYDVEAKINKIKAEIQKLPITERQMLSITRKFDLNDQIYTYLLQKRTEAGITLASNKADARVLDRAQMEHVKVEYTSTGQNRSTALIIGFMIPLMIILIRDFFDGTLRDKNEIETNTNVPVIGSIMHNLRDTEIPVIEFPKSPISEAFRSVRTNIQYFLVGKEHHVIVVNSTVSGEGKTFCAINLAAIISTSNKKTLLIGLDLRKPKIHKHFKLQNNIGLSTYLVEKHTIEEIIQPTYIDNLFIIPSGPVPPNPAELIETERMKQLINKVKTDFDYVIIDTPPITAVTDALLIARFADAMIFVVRINYSLKNVIKLVDDLADNENIRALSVLVNDNIEIKGYGGRYGSYYMKNKNYYEVDIKETLIEKIKNKIKNKFK